MNNLNEMNEKLEQMARDYYQGLSVAETIRKTLGEDIAARTGELEQMVGSLSSKISSLNDEYDGMNLKMAVFQEIDKQCGEDTAAQFQMVSDLKYLVSMHNFAASKEIQEEQGQDTDFIEGAIQKTHEMEQKMAQTASPQELEALRDELARVLPDNQEDMFQAVSLEAENAGWGDLLKKAEEAKEGISEQARKDISVLAAAIFLSGNSDSSAKEAALAGVVHIEECLGMVDWVIICMAAASSGFFAVLLGEITGWSILTVLGFAGMSAAALVVGILTLVSAGEAAYEAVKKAIPYVKSAWEKCRPRLEEAASKVKEAVAAAFGVIADKVFRPVIYWASNSALPVIREKIWYPLERRLQGMLEWLQQKKEQVISFVKSASAAQDVPDAEGQEEENEEDFTFEDLEEAEFES